MKAIVYTSNSGHTKQYAEILGSKTGYEVCELNEARKLLPAGSEVIYMGWLMAGVVKGYAKARKRFNIKAVCAVGMTRGSQTAQIKNTSGIPAETPVFYLQGGLEINRLHGLYKMMMNFMGRNTLKNLKAKKTLTSDEAEMKNLFEKGASLVSAERLDEVIAWING